MFVLHISSLVVISLLQPSLGAVCNVKADIVFLLDSSQSAEFYWQDQLDYFVSITESLDVGKDHAQFASISYAYAPRLDFDFNDYQDRSSLVDAINDLRFGGSSTYASKALTMAREELFSSKSRGVRPDATKILILIMDENSKHHPGTEGRELQKMGVHNIAIGIYGDIDRNTNGYYQLKSVASSEDDVFLLKNLGHVSETKYKVLSRICGHAIIAPPTPAPTFKLTTPKCEPHADIVFLLDSSKAVASNWQVELAFAVSISEKFKIGKDDVQVSAVTFSSHAEKAFDFNRYWYEDKLKKALESVKNLRGDTSRPDIGFDKIRTEIFKIDTGARYDAVKVAILITDGRSQDDQLTIAAANRLKSTGVFVMTLGIAGAVSREELKGVASRPQDAVFQVNYDSYSTVFQDFYDKICSYHFMSPPTPKPTHKPTVPSGGGSSCAPFADIVFSLDSSGSVGSNWNTELDFAASIANKFALGPDDVQIGAVTFSSYAEPAFHLNKYRDHTSLAQGFKSVKNIRRSTATDTGFDKIRTEMFQRSAGARPDAIKVVILITDGESNNEQLTLAAAKKLKDMGVTILVVGIGPVKSSELKAIANNQQDVFFASDFGALSGIDKAVYDKTCKATT